MDEESEFRGWKVQTSKEMVQKCNFLLENLTIFNGRIKRNMMKVSPQMQGEGTCGHRNSQIFQRGKASPFDPRCHCVDVAGCVWWGIRARQLVTFFPYLWRHLPRAVPKAQRRHRGEKLDLCISLYFLKRNPIFVFRKCVRVSNYFKSAIKLFAF